MWIMKTVMMKEFPMTQIGTRRSLCPVHKFEDRDIQLKGPKPPQIVVNVSKLNELFELRKDVANLHNTMGIYQPF